MLRVSRGSGFDQSNARVIEEGEAGTADEACAPQVQALVRLAQARDAAAFAHLYQLFVGRVYGIALRACAERAVAEEVTQEVSSGAAVRSASSA